MTRLSRRTAGSGTLLIAVVILLYRFADGRYEPIEPVASARESLAPDLIEKSRLQPSNAYEILEERPLFSMTRRLRPLQIQPVPTIAAPQPSPVSEPPTLSGILVASDQHVALIRAENGRTVAVAEGNAFAGWIVDQVRPHNVVFRMGAKVIPVELSWNTARQNTAVVNVDSGE